MKENNTAKKEFRGTPFFCLIIGLFLSVRRIPLAITGIQEAVSYGGISVMLVINILCSILGLVNIILFVVLLVKKHREKDDAYGNTVHEG